MNDPTTGDQSDDHGDARTVGDANGSPSAHPAPRTLRRASGATRSAETEPRGEEGSSDHGEAEAPAAGGAAARAGGTDDDGVTEAASDRTGDTQEVAAMPGTGPPVGARRAGAGDDPDADDEPSPWSELRPLLDSDLAALDPASLEEDIASVDDAAATDLDEPPPPPTGPASDRTAHELTSAAVLRTRSRPPRSGWRRFIHRATGGVVSPGASRSDREREGQLQAMRTLVTRPRRITVLSRKGGVGKTTTTLMLGQTLASERGDRIIAVDGNPDAGNLGHRIAPDGAEGSITDVLNEVEDIHRYADMRRFTTQTSAGLEVLSSDDDPQISTALGDEEYATVLKLLDRFYNLVLIDTGTGILGSAVQGILDTTDQIVLVVAPSLDAARSASQTLDWLNAHGFVGLVENAVAVINQARRSTMIDVARIEDHFYDRCGATVRIPWDAVLEAGVETELEDLRPATREAYRHLAAAVARRFDRVNQ